MKDPSNEGDMPSLHGGNLGGSDVKHSSAEFWRSARAAEAWRKTLMPTLAYWRPPLKILRLPQS
eukprot:5830550-Alexandrium_andersonii.AAC.1